MRYFITYHAIERLKERFAVFYNKQPELKLWSKEKGTSCVKPLFDKWVSKSEENRSYLNNTMYMLKLYEKYGYESEYKFLEYKEENILFIFTKNRSENHYRLVTLMPTEFRPSVKNIKYNNKEKKADKHTKFIMDWYDNLDIKNKAFVEKIPNIQPDCVSLECSPELKKKLIELVCNNKTQILTKLSNTKSLHKVILDDLEYEFIYSKTTSGNKDICLKQLKEISEEQKNRKILESYMTPELRIELLKLVHDNLTESIKISNTKTEHKVSWQGLFYHFVYQKSSNGDRHILLKEKPTQVIENTIELSNTRKFKP